MFRDSGAEYRFHRRLRQEYNKKLARIVPRVKKTLRRLLRKHRGIFRLGRYRKKNTLARENAKGRVELFSVRPFARAPKASGPYNYQIPSSNFVQITVTLKRMPTKKWRQLMTRQLRKAVQKAFAPHK